MIRRVVIVVLLASGLAGCALPEIPSPDSILVALGLPKRGFAADSVFPDDATPTTPASSVARTACTSETCPQAVQFCTARGYRPGTDGFARCLVSVEQNLSRP